MLTRSQHKKIPIIQQVKEDTTIEIPNAIFHEGGDSYRPLIIIPVPSNVVWHAPNICFYRSSGRSNEKSAGNFTNTWFPIGGVVQRESITLHNGERRGRGHIIKMSDLNDKYLDWMYDLIDGYSIRAYGVSISDAIANLKSNKEGINIHAYKTMEEKTYAFYIFLKSYFLYDWQVKISALIGGGYWQLYPDFHQYVLNAIMIPERIPPIPRFPREEDFQSGLGIEEIIAFLNVNHAQVDIRQIILPPHTEEIRKKTMGFFGLNRIIEQYENTITLLTRYSKKNGGRTKRKPSNRKYNKTKQNKRVKFYL